MALLVRTPAPFATESLFGFLLRVSESNGYDSFKDVLHVAAAGPTQLRILPGFPIEKLAQVLGRDTRELSPLAYRVDDRDLWHFKLLDHDLGQRCKTALRLDQPALCPQCVSERRDIDAFWDLRGAVACPAHRRKALRRRHECGDDIRWRRPGLLTCHCGACFLDAPCDQVDDPTVELMNVLHAKLHGFSVKSLPNTSGFPLEALDELPLRSLAHVLHVLGTQSLWGRRVIDSDDQSVVAAAVDALAQWPHGYHRLLKDFGTRAISENPCVLGYSKQFGAFCDAMFNGRALSGNTEFFKKQFIRFGLLEWGHAALDRKLLGLDQHQEQRFISKTQFARRFGLWTPTMKRLIADGTLVTKTLRTARIRRVVIDVRASNLPVESAGIVTAREAADYLGLPVSVLQRLRDMGVFVTHPRRGRKASWHRDDMEGFLARALALPEAAFLIRETMPLKDVMRLKLRDPRAKADIVAALFDDRLSVAGRTGRNFGGLLLDKRQLNHFVLQMRVEIESGTCSLPEVAAQTGVDMSAVPDAIASGLLIGVEMNGRLRVRSSSVERFNAEYVPLSQLAQKFETSTRRLLRICRTDGMQTILLRRTACAAEQPILPRNSINRLTELWEAERCAAERKQRTHREKLCKKAMRKYLRELWAQNGTLPRHAGEPNKAVIARYCGFSRDALYSYPSVIALLEEFDRFERQNRSNQQPASLAAFERQLPLNSEAPAQTN